jgi:hypothetical protein
MNWFLAELPMDTLVWILAGVLGFLVFLLVGYRFLSQYTGFGEHVVKETETFEYRNGEDKPPVKTSESVEKVTPRTFWDWMTILTISAVIGVVALMYANRQAAEQQELQELQVMDDAVQAYLDHMTQIMLDDRNPLPASGSESAAGKAARAWTLTALNRLDGEHNQSVITFVKESGLVTFETSRGQKGDVLRLDDADLSGANLENNELGGFNLRYADLPRANLHDATLSVANLTFADLSNADLTGAELRDTSLVFANLDRADLKNADLRHADLRGAYLKTAKNLTQEQVDQASEGNAATSLPDGIETPSRWISTNPPYDEKTDPRLKGMLVAVEPLGLEIVSQAGIPTKGIPKEKETTSGALVYRVQPGSLADDAGFELGDIIVKVGPDQARPVHGPKDLRDLDQYEVEGEVVFTIWRSYFDGYKDGPVHVRLGD